MNVFFRIGDLVVTPPLEDSLLAGVTRDSILALLREWKVKVEERPLSIAEVAEASARGKLAEAFGTGTAATISSIGELQWGEKTMKLGSSRGEVAERLYRTLTELFGSRRPDRRGWLVPVDPS